MSSAYVREKIEAFLAANAPSEKVVVLDGRIEEIRDLAEQEGLVLGDPWLGVEYIPGDETPITVPATNDQGTYREDGIILFHVVAAGGLGSAATNAIVTRAEALRSLFRGRRIEDIRIEGVSPTAFGNGATLQFEGGYVAGTFIVSFERDLKL